MKKNSYIFLLAKGLKQPSIGNKAQSLLFLCSHGFRIPETYILVSKAYEEYVRSGGTIPESLKNEVRDLPDQVYAIRSSTTLEDSESHSYAGQFLTITNIRGYSAILNAIEEVWRSATLNLESGYHRKVAGSLQSMSCSVIIQKMVGPAFSGVSFSKNPVTDLNETVIEAVEGAGEDLVQKGVTPYRWRIKGDVIFEGAENHGNIHIIRKIAADTLSLKKLYKKDVDIEWAFDGQNIYYLQVRGVREAEQVPVYSSRMVREMLPGQIKPLVWDVNIPLFNTTFIRLLSEITGSLDIDPLELTKPFYYRIYLNMALMGKLFSQLGLPADSLEYMLLNDKGVKPKVMPGLKVLRHTFRIIRFIYSKLNFERTFRNEFRLLDERYKLLKRKIEVASIIEEYPLLFEELFREGGRLVYINIVVPLLMQYYNKKLKSRLTKANADYDLISFRDDFPELDEISPVNGMNTVRQKYGLLIQTAGKDFETLGELSIEPEAKEVVSEFEKFMQRFGHLSDSGTDFSVRKWQEDPEMVFRMIKQSPARTANSQQIPFRSLPIRGFKKSRLRRLYEKAGKFKVYREQISSLYIFGYGLFRLLYLKLGREFVTKGILREPEDIFFLTRSEVEKMIPGTSPVQFMDYSDIVAQRKEDIDESKDYILPSVIYGEKAPFLEHGKVKTLKGVGTSPGTYSGRTRVVKDAGSFASVCEGDVLIIPFSDISWTPILIRAGAIVSESGGMLSHCSIIAREFGIPALVSVDNACSLIIEKNVTVDGFNGILTVHDDE